MIQQFFFGSAGEHSVIRLTLLPTLDTLGDFWQSSLFAEDPPAPGDADDTVVRGTLFFFFSAELFWTAFVFTTMVGLTSSSSS